MRYREESGAHRLSYVESISPVPEHSESSPESQVSGLSQNHRYWYLD
ncbi:hypothetical protein T12_2717 [Trichinella patagoniensis]|uniref:Uncharacterized protein n=1 Tax=Trichinella patagoniensis TaxID=990121 RepID=A0A0V0W074_9BILA|nr:hypothetical protein T12_2717 [Trichinella patagoniensis]